MESASTLVECGLVQILCAVFLLLFKILGNSVTYNYKETLHQHYEDHSGSHFQSRAKVIPLVHVDVASIVLYAITGVLLLCLSSRTKNLCLILSVNISTLLSLFGASGLTIFALVAILSDPSEGTPVNLLQAIFVLLNSLVMLIATMVSTMEIWRISFYSSNAAMDSLTNVNVNVRGNRSPPSGPRSTLQVANERNTPSSQPAEANVSQHFTPDAKSGEDENGEAPPPYHIATGKFPCKHCRFTAKNKNNFIEHFQRRPDHWSCLFCKRRFTTFKDYSRLAPNASLTCLLHHPQRD